jgi:hypothetical protein
LSRTTGSSNSNIDPLTTPGDAQMRPSWCSMIERQMASPIPIPLPFVVNSGLKIRSTSEGSIPLPLSSIDTCTAPDSLRFDRAQHPRLREVHGLEGIHQQVHDNLLQLDLAAGYVRQSIIELRLELDLMLLNLMPPERYNR